MRGMIFGFATLTVLTSTLLVPRVLAAIADEIIAVSIVEPAGGTPQDWIYAPGDLTITVGTPITWTNTGAVAHTVTADDGVSFDSGNLDPQATFSFTPNLPGTFAYHCAYHPWIMGTFTVRS
jgi:plastocyanin